METFMKADIFFFVTTIAVVLVTVGIICVFFHLARFLSTCNRIARNVESKAEDIGEDAKEMIADIKESFLFRLMFPKPKKKSRAKRK